MTESDAVGAICFVYWIMAGIWILGKSDVILLVENRGRYAPRMVIDGKLIELHVE